MLPEIFEHGLEHWRTGRFTTGDGLRSAVMAFGRQADPATNVTLVNVAAPDPGAFAVSRAVHNVDLRASWNRLAEYPDADYIGRHVAPQYSHVKIAREPFVDTIRARIQDVFVVYDRLLLPATDGSAQILSLTRTRMILEPCSTPDDLHITPRESDIVSCLASGLSAKETALALKLSHRTVEHRIDGLKRRFQARNVTHLVCLVMASGLSGRASMPTGLSVDDRDR